MSKLTFFRLARRPTNYWARSSIIFELLSIWSKLETCRNKLLQLSSSDCICLMAS